MKNHRIFLGKIGAEKTISVYWFAILIIVAGVIIYMVTFVYGKPYDIRGSESEILSGNIANCLSEGGYLKENTLTNPSFKQNFLKICKVNLKTPDFPETKGEYYIEVNFYDFNTGSKLNSSTSEGNINLKQYCGLEGKTNPVCSNKDFYVIDKGQKAYSINIISVVNKADKNVQ